MRFLRSTGLYLIFMALLTAMSFATSKPAPPQPQAPLPAQLLTAKKVFISNGGSTTTVESADVTYEAFYRRMKGWGKFELVSVPADADLVFEISYSEPSVFVNLPHGVLANTDPQVRLKICDPKTGVLLWTITEHAKHALRVSNRLKNIDTAESNLVDRLAAELGAVPPVVAAAPALPKEHSSDNTGHTVPN